MNLKVKKNVLCVQITEIQEKCGMLLTENLSLHEHLKEASYQGTKEKGESSNLQFELEEKMNKFQLDLTASFERNIELEKDMVHV